MLEKAWKASVWSTGHLLEGSAGRFHGALDRAHGILIGDRHALEHLLHCLEGIGAAGGQLLAHQTAEFRLGLGGDFSDLARAQASIFSVVT